MMRTEVRSTHGDSHLGHVFRTPGIRRLRYHQLCRARFIIATTWRPRVRGLFQVAVSDEPGAVLAGGCFWGVQNSSAASTVFCRRRLTGGSNAHATYRNHPDTPKR